LSRSGREISAIAKAGLVLHIWIVAAVCPLLDRFLTLERMLRLFTSRRPFGPYVGISPYLIAAIVHRRLRTPVNMRRRACLRLSLVLYHFLRLSGAEPVFHVAVFPPSVDPERLHAHSWVTVGEVCLCEPLKERAVEILTYGPAAASRLSGEKGLAVETIASGRRDVSAREDWTGTNRHV
jgi:hypothetical protein